MGARARLWKADSAADARVSRRKAMVWFPLGNMMWRRHTNTLGIIRLNEAYVSVRSVRSVRRVQWRAEFTYLVMQSNAAEMNE